MKTNLRERLTMYQCVIKPKVHFVPEFSFKRYLPSRTTLFVLIYKPSSQCIQPRIGNALDITHLE